MSLDKIRRYLRRKPSVDQALLKDFDADFYRSKYTDVALAGIDPLKHYLDYGWREGRWPNAWFDPDAYWNKFPEIDSSSVNPYLHFLANREKSERVLVEELEPLQKNKLLLFSDAVSQLGEKGGQDHAIVMNVAMPPRGDIDAVQHFFDAEYYLQENPDLAARGVNPLLHFMAIGWIEGRNPSADFSTGYYVRNNRDIREQRINPFVHYVKAGRHEGWRKPRPLPRPVSCGCSKTMPNCSSRSKRQRPWSRWWPYHTGNG